MEEKFRNKNDSSSPRSPSQSLLSSALGWSSSSSSYCPSTKKVHNYLTILLLLYINCLTWTNTNNLTTTSPQGDEQQHPQQQQQRTPRLGDGCYHIFIDVGANIGVHGRFLLEPKKYPHSIRSVELFREEYGLDHKRHNIDYCIFAMEANPKHWTRLDEVSHAYATHTNVESGNTVEPWRYTIIKAAVSDQVGNMTFYHQGKEDELHNEWGFSTVHDYRKEEDTQDPASMEVVPSIRLSDWIQYHIVERNIPTIPPSLSVASITNTSIINNNDTNNNRNYVVINGITTKIKPPIVGMKMDIEGSEYIVLPDLLLTGTICSFDFVFGEFHAWFAPIEPSPGHRVPLTTFKELQEYEWAITKVMESSRNCHVRWLTIDDESYLHDGQPLPTVTGNSTGNSTGTGTGTGSSDNYSDSDNDSDQRRLPSSSNSQSQVPHPLENLTSLQKDTNKQQQQ